MSERRVIFVHRPAHASTGAKRMRDDQFRALIAPHLPDDIVLETFRLPPKRQLRRRRQAARQVIDAVVIFHKRAWLDFDEELLALWRERARAIVVDWVDAYVSDPACEVDLHLAASEAGRAYLADRFGEDRAALIDHHADPALTGLASRGADTELKPIYLGHPANVTLPETLKERVAIPDYSGGPLDDALLDELAQANLHWAVRGAAPPEARNFFKPFTKGANAAALRSNVVIERSADDATRFLGSDYPFLVDDTAPETLTAVLDRAAGTIGTPEWDDALAVMADVNDRLSPPRIARQFEDALARFWG